MRRDHPPHLNERLVSCRAGQAGQQLLRDLRIRHGVEYAPNLPTEEVFTSPDWRRVNGTVSCTRPLAMAGSLVSGLRLRLKEGANRGG
jgi:leucyl aminopeptidase (aminopeptidase T)